MLPINIYTVFYCGMALNNVEYLYGTSPKFYKDYKEYDYIL